MPEPLKRKRRQSPEDAIDFQKNLLGMAHFFEEQLALSPGDLFAFINSVAKAKTQRDSPSTSATVRFANKRPR